MHSPVLSGVGEIVLDNGPDEVPGGGIVSVVDQPLGVGDESNGSQGRTISLRAAPFSSELLEINHELGLAETSTALEGAGGVVYTLELGLGDDKVLDVGLEVLVVAVDESIGDELEDKGGISRPRIPVCCFLCVSALVLLLLLLP